MGNTLFRHPVFKSPFYTVPLLAGVSLLGGLGYGYLLGVSAVTLGPIAVDFESDFADKDAFMSAFLLGIVSAAGLLGGFIGAMIGGRLCNLLGRRLVMLLVALIGLLGTVLTSTMPLFWLLVVARVITGFSSGLATVVCPLYVGERSPPKLRGALGTLFQTGIQSGILISYCMGLLILTLTDVSPWRWIYGCAAIIYALNLVLVVGMPETESWIAGRRAKKLRRSSTVSPDAQALDRSESDRQQQQQQQQLVELDPVQSVDHREARKVLDPEVPDAKQTTSSHELLDRPEHTTLSRPDSSRGPGEHGEDFSFQEMALSPTHSVHSQARPPSASADGAGGSSPRPRKGVQNVVDILKLTFGRKNIGLLFVGTLLCLDFQFTGVNALVFFSTTILKAAFPEGNGSIVATIAIGCWNVLSTIVGALLIERIGRRWLILIGMTLKGVAMTGLGLAFHFMSGTALGFVALGFMAMFYFGFATGIGSLLFVVLNEFDWPARIKDTMVSCLVGVMWIGSLVLVLLFLPLSEAVGTAWVFIIFAVISAVSVVILFFTLKESLFQKKAKKPTAKIAEDKTEMDSSSRSSDLTESDQRGSLEEEGGEEGDRRNAGVGIPERAPADNTDRSGDTERRESGSVSSLHSSRKGKEGP